MRLRAGWKLLLDQSGDCRAQEIESRRVLSKIPTTEIERLHPPELERDVDAVDQDRYQDAASDGLGRLRLDPVRLHRVDGPEDDDASSRAELALDDLSPFLPRRDGLVPHDRPALRSEPV